MRLIFILTLNVASAGPMLLGDSQGQMFHKMEQLLVLVPIIYIQIMLFVIRWCNIVRYLHLFLRQHIEYLY
jgi:hypothetical protein